MKLKITEVGEVFQRLYDSEINHGFTFRTDWDAGYYFHVGSALGDKELKQFSSTKIEEAVQDLANFFAQQYPNSDFAKWWKTKS